MRKFEKPIMEIVNLSDENMIVTSSGCCHCPAVVCPSGWACDNVEACASNSKGSCWGEGCEMGDF